MGLWFLYQTYQLLSSIKEEDNDDTVLGDLSSDDGCNAPKPQKRMIFGNLVYPPYDSSTLYKMCNYLITQKQIPVDIPHNLTSISIDSIPKAFIPIENRCNECDQKLKGPLLLPKNGKVLTMNGVLHDHTTFIKVCLACRVCYRYQDITDGVHNFDDKFLISLDMCIFIRDSFKNRVAVGTVCDILQEYLHIKLKQQTIFNAYMHVVTLTEHAYNVVLFAASIPLCYSLT